MVMVFMFRDVPFNECLLSRLKCTPFLASIMGTCVLVAIGDEFRVDDFLKTSRFKPMRVFRKGDVPPVNKLPRPTRQDSGFALIVSDDPNQHDLTNQIPEALEFLCQNEEELVRVREFGAEDLLLDFGFVPDKGLQNSVSLPPDLILAMARFGMGAVFSVIQIGRG